MSFLFQKLDFGYLINYGGQVFKLDLVMTGIVILGIVAGLMYGAITLLEKMLLKFTKFYGG